jgi:hypothetical protein
MPWQRNVNAVSALPDSKRTTVFLSPAAIRFEKATDDDSIRRGQSVPAHGTAAKPDRRRVCWKPQNKEIHEKLKITLDK